VIAAAAAVTAVTATVFDNMIMKAASAAADALCSAEPNSWRHTEHQPNRSSCGWLSSGLPL
jgi:hypothetical protein